MTRLHHRGLACVLTSLLTAAAWPEAGAWREDFERVDVGSLPAGWQRQIVPPGSTIGVQRAARPGKPDNKALAAADRRGDKQLIVYAPFPAIRGVVAAEVWREYDATLLLPDGEEKSVGLIGVPSDSAILNPNVTAGRSLQPGDANALVFTARLAAKHVSRWGTRSP